MNITSLTFIILKEGWSVYVRDLMEGLLVKPAKSYQWQIRPILESGALYNQKEGIDELNESGIHHHVTPVYRRNPGRIKNDIAVYLGVKVIKTHYYGVKKQHMLLINGTVAIVDGYQFKDIEKV